MKKISTLKSFDHSCIVSRLIEARKEAGLTQNKVADKLGESQSFISKLEAGQRHIDVVTFYKMTKIYKWKLTDYFDAL